MMKNYIYWFQKEGKREKFTGVKWMLLAQEGVQMAQMV